jgi:hypothetical protein
MNLSITSEPDKTQEGILSNKWFLENGLVTNDIMDNLILWGYLSHHKIKSTSVDLDLPNKKVIYSLSFPKKTIKRYEYIKNNLTSKNLLKRLKVWYFLKREGIPDGTFLAKCIKDYLGPKWLLDIEIKENK